MAIRANPLGGTRPVSKKRPGKFAFEYLEPLKRLRSLGIDPVKGKPLSAIKSVNDLTDGQRRAILGTYSYYEYLFSHPHIVADFSLPEEKIRDRYQQWTGDVSTKLKKDGFTAKEIKAALRGTYNEYRDKLIRQNDDLKLSAQDFGGHKILDKNLKAAVIPVVTGMPDKVRLKLDADGRMYVQEKHIKTYNIKFDPAALAKGGRKYLEQLLAPYDKENMFLPIVGEAHTSGALASRKEKFIDNIVRMMNAGASGKTLKRIGKDRITSRHSQHWTNWLRGVRVMTGGDALDRNAVRRGWDTKRREMKAAKRAAHEAMEALKQGKRREQAKVRKRRQRSR